MKGDRVPDQHHIARYCQPKYIADEQIQPGAFMLRPTDESLSVNWLEFLNCLNRENEIAELRKIYSKKLRVGARAKTVVLNVGEVREKVRTESSDVRNLKVLHDPEYTEAYDDESHSGIYNLRNDDELIAELILETIQEVYFARK